MLPLVRTGHLPQSVSLKDQGQKLAPTIGVFLLLSRASLPIHLPHSSQRRLIMSTKLDACTSPLHQLGSIAKDIRDPDSQDSAPNGRPIYYSAESPPKSSDEKALDLPTSINTHMDDAVADAIGAALRRMSCFLHTDSHREISDEKYVH